MMWQIENEIGNNSSQPKTSNGTGEHGAELVALNLTDQAKSLSPMLHTRPNDVPIPSQESEDDDDTYLR